MNKNLHKQALIRGLLFSSPLVEKMEGAEQFDVKLLEMPVVMPEISFEQKLGHVYEDALGELLEISSQLQLLGKSLQIFNDKRLTLGELDYLIKYGDRVIHLELAVKFYMVYYDDKDVACFPGPDPTDNWLNKLKRLENHQLKMSQNEYAKSFLLENYEVDDVEVQHLIYGRLFDHVSEQRRPVPRGMAEDAQRSEWLYVSEWRKCYSSVDEVYIIPKHLWPVPASELSVELLEFVRLLSVKDLLERVSDQGRCEMVFCRGWDAPVFVVPEAWPNG